MSIIWREDLKSGSVIQQLGEKNKIWIFFVIKIIYKIKDWILIEETKVSTTMDEQKAGTT